MDILNHYFIALLVTGIVHLSLAAFVLFKGIKKRINQTYAFYSASIAIWAIFEAFGIISYNSKIALLLWRINHMGVIFITIGFVHFVYCTTNITGKRQKLIPISYLIGFIFAILNTTNLLILEVVPKFSFRYFINPGPTYYLFFILWISWMIYGLFELFRAYFKSSGAKRNQMKYFCWSMLIAYIGGIPNFFPTFNIEIPILMPFGTYAIPIYAFFTVYAIIKYRLMDITIFVTRTLIFSIVYLFVLGIPLGLTGWGKSWLQGLFGQNWYWAPVILAIILASAGPFIFMSLRRRAEDLILRDQRRYQKALRELSKTMTRIRDLDKLLKMIVLTVVDTVKVSFAGIYLKDEEHNSYQLKHYFPKLKERGFPEFIPLDSSLIKSLYKQKRPIMQEEVDISAGFPLDSGLVIPCFMEDELLGFLIMGAKPNNQIYTPDDVLVFETLSYSTSLAIENCRFWQEIEDRQRKARLQEMDTYSYSLAHEIDNPVQVILGQAGFLKKFFLKDASLPQEQQKDAETMLDFILECASRISGMVRAIREFGSPTTRRLKPLKIEDVIESFLRLYLPQFKSEGIILEKNLTPNLGIIRGEKPELMQVLVILANNSLHAMKYAKEKRIILKLEQPNLDLIRVSFTDTGCGIKKELLPIIFSPFTTTKASSEGSGMGLYNAKKIIDRHKGRIWAESEGENKGATFFIELAVAKDVKPEELERKDEDKRLF